MILRTFSSIPSFLGDSLIMKGCWILSNAFSTSIEMTMYFFFHFILLMWQITSIYYRCFKGWAILAFFLLILKALSNKLMLCWFLLKLLGYLPLWKMCCFFPCLIKASYIFGMLFKMQFVSISIFVHFTWWTHLHQPVNK